MKIILLTEDELSALVGRAVDDALETFITKHSDKVKSRTNYITAADVAKMTNAHFTTVRRWAKEGLIKGYKIDRKLLFDSDEVDEFVRKKQIQRRIFPES